MKNSNNDNSNNSGTINIGDIYEAKNKGKDIIAELCPLILDKIYETTNDDDYSLTNAFEEEKKIDSINNRIIQYKQPLKSFWRNNQKVEKLILLKNKTSPTYAGRIYGRFKSLYEDNKLQFIDESDFGDLIITFVQKEIKKQIKEWHDMKGYQVSDLQDGVRFLTFHAFYKCKILENPNDSK